MSDVFCRKFYVDSAQRIAGTSSDFTFSLVRNITIPKHCAAYVSDVAIPHTWTNVDTHANMLYWEELVSNVPIATQQWQLPIDNYTGCLLYTSPSPRDGLLSRMPSSA